MRKNRTRGHLPPCPKCGAEAKSFKRHAKRPRIFLVIVDQIVEKALGLLARFKCPGCGKSVTEYPDFALPHKRYTVPTLFDFCQRYVDRDDMTYRKLVQETPVGYKAGEGKTPDSQLDFPTIHRWIGSLGRFERTVRGALDLILQKDPATTICRDLAAMTIPSRKYITEARRRLLLGCRHLLELEKEYHHQFNISIFTNLATKHAYG